MRELDMNVDIIHAYKLAKALLTISSTSFVTPFYYLRKSLLKPQVPRSNIMQYNRSNNSIYVVVLCFYVSDKNVFLHAITCTCMHALKYKGPPCTIKIQDSIDIPKS